MLPIKLKSLPVVGDLISDEVGEEELVPSLRFVVASKAFTIKEIRVLNDKIPDKEEEEQEEEEEEEEEEEKLIPPLPVPKKVGTEDSEGKRSVRKGLSLSGKLGLPDAAKILSLSISPQEEEEDKEELAPGGKEEEGDVTNSKLAVWFDIDKTFGPFSLKQIGFRYDEEEDETAKIAILMDAAIKISGLTLSCDDLG